jgi:hypothetical protein
MFTSQADVTPLTFWEDDRTVADLMFDVLQVEWKATTEHLVQDDTNAPHVARTRMAHVLNDFRRHVAFRPYISLE